MEKTWWEILKFPVFTADRAHGHNVPSVTHCRHLITALYSYWPNYVALPLENIYHYDVPSLLKSEIIIRGLLKSKGQKSGS